MELWLIHPRDEVGRAFRERFDGLPDVRVIRAAFEDLDPHDAFVTAGNSFGHMSAGIDAAVVQRFGPGLRDRVRSHIAEHYLGEQPVGTAFVVPTHDADIPWLVHAPTMRVPGNIEGTDRVYAATWAALLAARAHNRQATGSPIRTLAMPAMGTGFGGVDPSEAARQMAAAWRLFVHPIVRPDWPEIADRQRAICYDGTRQVVKA